MLKSHLRLNKTVPTNVEHTKRDGRQSTPTGEGQADDNPSIQIGQL